MGEEWVEIAALWESRNKESRLLCKGKTITQIKEGEKVLIMKNQYATDENRQPQYRLMVIRENPNVPFEELICLHCGEIIPSPEDPNEMVSNYHEECYAEIEEDKIEESRINPYGMG